MVTGRGMLEIELSRQRERERGDAVAERRKQNDMWNALEIVGWLVGSCALLLLVQRIRRSSTAFPPGPPAWPIIGHLHLFSHRLLIPLSHKYGHILGLRLGLRPIVVVSSPEFAKEVLGTNDKIFACRPAFTFASLMFFGPSNGVIFSHGPDWRHYRKICVLQLFTTKRLQQLQYVRQQELRGLLLSINDQSGGGRSAIDLGHCMGHMSARLLMRLLHSRMSGEVCDEDLYVLIRDQELEMVPSLGDFIPFLSCLDFFGKRRMRRMHARLDKVYTELLMQRRQSTSAAHDDLLHALLSQEEPLSVYEIKSILHDMLGAGIHTTALTIEWAMAELLRNPACLHKLKREIEMHVGEKNQVTDEDLPKLSYLKCVIKESSRLHPVLPLLPRISMEECKVQGYTIPAQTIMFVNIWAIGRDERVWANANEFIPERFEGMDLDVRGQHFELLPFGAGRRICMGMPLALSVVEVTLANLVNSFEWELAPGETRERMNMDEKLGFTAGKKTPLMVVPKPRVLISELQAENN